MAWFQIAWNTINGIAHDVSMYCTPALSSSVRRTPCVHRTVHVPPDGVHNDALQPPRGGLWQSCLMDEQESNSNVTKTCTICQLVLTKEKATPPCGRSAGDAGCYQPTWALRAVRPYRTFPAAYHEVKIVRHARLQGRSTGTQRWPVRRLSTLTASTPAVQSVLPPVVSCPACRTKGDSTVR